MRARRMVGSCSQNADQLGYFAGLYILTVYAGVVNARQPHPCIRYHSTRWKAKTTLVNI
jgi:hypothetical protein